MTTVSELRTALATMPDADEIVIALIMQQSPEQYIPTRSGGVYAALVNIAGVETAAAVIEAGDDLEATSEPTAEQEQEL